MALGKSVRFYCEVCGADLTQKAEELFRQELDRVNLSVCDLHNLAVKNLRGEDVETFLENRFDIRQRVCIEVISRQLLYIVFGALACSSCDAPIEEW